MDQPAGMLVAEGGWAHFFKKRFYFLLILCVSTLPLSSGTPEEGI